MYKANAPDHYTVSTTYTHVHIYMLTSAELAMMQAQFVLSKSMWLSLMILLLVSQTIKTSDICQQTAQRANQLDSQYDSFMVKIRTQQDYRYFGLYKWNVQHPLHYQYIRISINLFVHHIAFKKLYQQLFTRLLDDRSCSHFANISRKLTYLRSIDPIDNLITDVTHVAVVADIYKATFRRYVSRTLLFQYMRDMIDPMLRAWNTCRGRVTVTRQCAQLDLAVEIQLGKFVFWLHKDTRLTTSSLTNGERSILERFVRLFAIDRIDWQLADFYARQYDTKWLAILATAKQKLLNGTHSYMFNKAVAPPQIPALMWDINDYVKDLISNKLTRDYTNKVYNILTEKKLHHVMIGSTTCFGLLGNAAIILMHRKYLSSTESHSKTFIALLAILDTTCLVEQAIVYVLHFSYVFVFCETEYVTRTVKVLANWTLAYMCLLRAITLMFPLYMKTNFTFRSAMKFYVSFIFGPVTLYAFLMVLFYIYGVMNIKDCNVTYYVKWIRALFLSIRKSVDILVPTNIPAGIILVSNIAVMFVIAKRKAMSSDRHNTGMPNQERQVLIMLILSGTAFLVLTLPHNINTTIISLWPVTNDRTFYFNRLDQKDKIDVFQINAATNSLTSFLLQPLNYGLNFYLYMLMKSYRQQFFAMVAWKRN